MGVEPQREIPGLRWSHTKDDAGDGLHNRAFAWLADDPQRVIIAEARAAGHDAAYDALRQELCKRYRLPAETTIVDERGFELPTPREDKADVSGWWLIRPAGSPWFAICLDSQANVLGLIEESSADAHLAARDRFAEGVRAIRAGRTSEQADADVARRVLAAWDVAAAADCSVERIEF